MHPFASLYLLTFLILLVLDFVWLSTAGRTVYVAEIGSLLRDSPNFLVAALFYALYAAGIVWFVLMPAAADQAALGRVIATGAFFGLVAYATYDLTNLATLKGFTFRIAMIDLAWGTFVSGAVSGLALLAARALKVI
jgi:uncharacterized membrane protein